MRADEKLGPNRASTIAELTQRGFTPTEISQRMQIPHRVVNSILNGKAKWEELSSDHAFQNFRAENKKKLQFATLNLSAKALEQVEKVLSKASALQAATIYGILRDKERLDAGEPTQRVDYQVHIEAAILTDTLERLLKSLKDDETNSAVLVEAAGHEST